MVSCKHISKLLLALLLAIPTLAQDERPPVSIPQPKLQRSTPTPDSTSTIVQVEYNYAIKDRDYLLSAPEELVRFIRAETELKVSLSWRILTLHDRSIMDALMLYMTGCDGEMHITQPEKKTSLNTCKTAACSSPRTSCPSERISAAVEAVPV